jgi:hypothetical protein
VDVLGAGGDEVLGEGVSAVALSEPFLQLGSDGLDLFIHAEVELARACVLEHLLDAEDGLCDDVFDEGVDLLELLGAGAVDQGGQFGQELCADDDVAVGLS